MVREGNVALQANNYKYNQKETGFKEKEWKWEMKVYPNKQVKTNENSKEKKKTGSNPK